MVYLTVKSHWYIIATNAQSNYYIDPVLLLKLWDKKINQDKISLWNIFLEYYFGQNEICRNNNLPQDILF